MHRRKFIKQAVVTVAASALVRRRIHAAPVEIVVHPGDNLQTAINNASPGDTLILDAGGTWTGAFTLPNKVGTATITIKSSALDSLPVGQRVGPSQTASMAKLQQGATTDPILRTLTSAHNYTFQGIEFAQASGMTIFDVVRLGDNRLNQTTLLSVPTDITIDRCYIHGTNTDNSQRGIALNSKNTTVRDSYISNIHWVGADSQGICGWNGTNTVVISNNYIEAAAENILIGGADSATEALMPAIITIERNFLFKPLSWKVGDPSYAGIHWSIKNLLEIKMGQSITVNGNVLQNSWGDAQIGYGVLFTVRNQEGTNPWAVVANVSFTNNTMSGTEQGFQLLGLDNLNSSQQSHDLTISNNLIQTVSNRGFTSTTTYNNVTIAHNTHFQGGNIMSLAGPTSTGFVCRDNITIRDPAGFGLFGDSVGEGTVALSTYMPGYNFLKNVYVAANSAIYPTNNFYPATVALVQFVDFAGGNYRLQSTSPYHNAATDGTDIGVNYDLLLAAQNGVTGSVTLRGKVTLGGKTNQ